ncbi:CoA pyrophosphatase [Falsiroseomonas oryzae]|uniref:CoA pyrophosphatase n=1 Tax=Falsiroseomonas oryzae TaxID=2766473 RepID=UPI0022EA7A84|nr:CoA pyrophosphatase [Roseomonas sp. MO-31]
MTAPPSRAEIAARLTDSERLALAVPTFSDDAEAALLAGRVRDAAVLVPIVWHAERPSILLTLRAAGLSSHAGQVAFPGGRVEPGETPEAAALREAAEEVGLDPRLPQVAGHLPLHLTGTGFRVTPVVAFLDPPLTLTPDPGEVATIFELPLATVLDPEAPERRRAEFRGRLREFWVWPHPEHLIWGATATMLVSLARVLRD